MDLFVKTPYWQHLAQHLLSKHGQDLSRTLVIVPEHFHQQTLRHHIQNLTPVCLLPSIQTLTALSDEYTQHATHSLSRQECILLLANELKEYRSLYGKSSRWGLAGDLYRLFSALTLEKISLTTQSEFIAQLQRQDASQFEWLSREGELVFKLWQAWHAQLEQEQAYDPDTRYLDGLKNFSESNQYESVYWLQTTYLTQSETSWWSRCQENMSCYKVDFEHPDSNFPYQFTYYPCSSSENQALAVLAAIQRQLQSDLSTPIYVITDDRKLIRRLQALLNRFEIVGDDKSGWGLSTTQAAAVIEHWLNCVENNFHYQALLDLLKSPYSFPDQENLAQTIHILEQDLIHRENITSDLNHYKRALLQRVQRLNADLSEVETNLIGVLDRLIELAKPLKTLLNTSHDLKRFNLALTDSLVGLGLEKSLNDDEAGILVWELLNESIKEHNLSRTTPSQALSVASSPVSSLASSLNMHWNDFRQWIHMLLEHTSFRPAVPRSHVTFLTHSQALWVDHGLIILCGMGAKHYPPRETPPPFFGEQVRTQLGLPPRDINDAYYKLSLERQIRQKSLILWQDQHNDEPLPLCNYLSQKFEQIEQLENFYDHNLEQWIPTPEVIERQPYFQPKPIVHGSLIKHETVSNHQRLIKCPYLFFSQDILGLGALDEVKEALEKSDYGSRVHLCLEAFHGQVNYLPGPFMLPLSEHTQQKAIDCLEKIADAVFEQDLKIHFEHESWLKRWKKMIPSYIRWQTSRQNQYTPKQTEYKLQDNEFKLRGRIDRIDEIQQDTPQKEKQYALIDYKTGKSPTKKEILLGEDVQLSTYAFVMEHINMITYLEFGSGDTIKEVTLEEDILDTLIPAVETRYKQLIKELKQGQGMSAWGEQSVCQTCHNANICRRELWHH